MDHRHLLDEDRMLVLVLACVGTSGRILWDIAGAGAGVLEVGVGVGVATYTHLVQGTLKADNRYYSQYI